MLDIGGSDAKKITLILLSLKNIFSLWQKILAPNNLKRNALKLKKVQLRLSQMFIQFFSSICVGLCRQSNFFPKSVFADLFCWKFWRTFFRTDYKVLSIDNRYNNKTAAWQLFEPSRTVVFSITLGIWG